MFQTYYQKTNSEWKKMFMRGIMGNIVVLAVLDVGDNGQSDYKVNFTTDPLADTHGHGSLMCSIIKSSIGLANGCILHSVKVGNDNGTFLPQNVINGLQYCIDNNVNVISMSFTLGGYNQAVQDKINQCAAAGIVMIASPGNSTTLSNILYPAGGLNVIAANTVDYLGVAFHKNGLVGSLNHGIDICCSGINAECIDKNGNLTFNSGSSLSAPWLAAATALEIEYLGYPPSKVAMDYILRRAIKQTNPVLYGQGLFTF